MYLPEWFYHHYYFGFFDFDIYINNTKDESIEIINRIRSELNVNINVIHSDSLFKKKGASFQSAAYQESIFKAKLEGFDYICFLDIDEFWTPLDFKTKIMDYLSCDQANNDVYLFNWALHCSESLFSPCFNMNDKFVLNQHVKCIAKLDKKIRPKIHNVVGDGLKYCGSNFSAINFLDDSKSKISFLKDSFPKAFVVHRLFRSQVEYVSLLSRGMVEGERFKTNRTGYYKKDIKGLNFNPRKNYFEAYKDGRDNFLTSLNNDAIIDRAKSFVLDRFRLLISEINAGVSIEEKNILMKAFNNLELSEIEEVKKILMNDRKIFQIGFNKSGTASIYNYFKNQGYNSIHWDDGRISKKIHQNFKNHLPLLDGYDEYQVFTDMEHRDDKGLAYYSAELYFKELDKNYPGSVFILNYRDVDKWIKSRINHPLYLHCTMKSTGLSEEEVVVEWKENYYRHINEVVDYFKHRENLIVLNIDTDDDEKLYRSLVKLGFSLKDKKLPHTHKTNAKKISEKQQHVNSIRNAALFFEDKDIEVALKLMELAHELRPEGPFILEKLNSYKQKLGV